ncbi:MAG: fibronectin type III domain-containing protein [Verrucomicrobiota bacterium]
MSPFFPIFLPRLWSRILSFLILATGLAVGQTAWIGSDKAGNDARFLYTNQVRSYDLTTKSWKQVVTLPRSGATAMASDAQGELVAYGTSVYRYAAGFTGESLLCSVASSIQSLFLDGNLLIVVYSQGLYGRIAVFNRTTGAKFSSVETYVDSIYGATHAPLTNRLYGRTQGISPSDIVTSSYTDAGVVANVVGSPAHGDYPSATKAWVFPEENRVVDSSGTVYGAPGLNYFGSLAGTVTDIAFRGDVPIVLRGSEVIAFSTNLLESGRAPVAAGSGSELFLSSTEALVFTPATGNPTVASVLFTAIKAPEPGTPIEPSGLAYTADQAMPDKDGNLLLFSKSQMSLFRWSPTEKKYTGSFPLIGAPKYAAYSKDNHSAYFAYDTKEVRKMDLSATMPKETPFFNLPTAPTGLATAGPWVFAADGSGAWGTHYIYSSAGTLSHSLDWNYYSRVWEWDAVKRRMYFFRDDTSPNDLHYETIDAAGKIAGEGETPYHGDFTVTPPIRVSPDGSKVVIGSGVVFETAGMTTVANLANGFSDAIWTGGKLVTLRLINGVSQLQTWEGNLFVAGATVRQFNGTPVGLWESAGGLLLVTSVQGTPRFTLLNSALEPLYISPTKPVSPGTPVVTGRTENSVNLQWQDLSDNEDGFRVEFRVGTGAWNPGASVGAGATVATVAGLPSSTTHEFRVVATNAALVSTPSGTVTATTLASANVPVGEPYNLRVTRIFNNRITVEWQDNATNETGFRVYRSTSSSSLGTQLSAPAGATSFTDTGLSPSTSYYYRVQAVNGADTGDLSAQVSGLTLSGTSVPGTPTAVKAVAESAHSVAVSWTDGTMSEEEFIVERSGSPASIWMEIGRTTFNKNAFTDTTVSPNTAYSYRVKSSNANGTSTSSTVAVTTPKLGGDFAGFSIRSGDVYYFAFKAPNRIERYDLVSRTWLAPVALEAAATALWADEAGIYVAEDRAIVRFSLAGGARTPMANGDTTVRALFTIGNTLVFQTGTYTTLNKLTGTFLSTFSYGYSGGGHSASPTLRKVFFRSTSVSPSDIHSLEVGTDGKLVKGLESPYHGDYPSATRTFVFPNGARVADDSGTVYATDSLAYNNSLGGAFTDLSFSGVDVPIVLRGNKLLAYNSALLESGSFALGSAGLRVAVAGADAVVFFADGANDHGLSVQAVSLAQLSAPVPGTPIDPRGLAYAPDDVLPDKDGNIMLFSKSQLSVFRWSPSQTKYLPTVPLIGAPAFAGYSKENHRLYLAYDSQVVRKMDLGDAAPVETPLFNLPSAPLGFTLAGEFPYVAVNNGLRTFSPAGESLTTGGFTYYYGNHNTWDPVNRRVYHFRDGTSPNDLHFDTISAAGLITGGGETPYHGDYSMLKPIRVSPDGSKVAIGSGLVFNATGLSKIASLANGFTDGTWFGGKLVTARLINGVTQLQTWTDPQFVAGPVTRQFTGTPVRLLALDPARLLLITLVDGAPRFSILNDALEPTYISPSKPLPPSALAVTGRSTNTVSLGWLDGSDNEGGFRIEYRPAAGSWTEASVAPANATTATVGSLSPGTTYEFRVSAISGDLSSASTAAVTAVTLSSPDQPAGEPYNFRVTRIFNDSITLEWADNAANETGFRILRSTTAGGLATEFVVSPGTTSFTSTGLAAGTYFFKLQVFNGSINGDLSAQVSATTLSSNLAPTAPSTLAATSIAGNSVTLGWKDNSSNENSFLVERSGSPASVWAPLGSVPFNVISFIDSTATPNTIYTYRVKSVNAIGSSTSGTITVTTPKLGGDFAGHSMRAGDVYYFAFSGPNRIERYNVVTRSWLPAIPLEAAATALWVDESAIFVAEDRAVIRFAIDGGVRTPVGNAEATVKALFTVSNVLAFGSSSGSLVTMNKLTGLFLSNISYSYSGTGYSAAPALNRVFFRSTGVSPSDIHYLEIGADGKLVKGDQSPYHGDYPSASRTFTFPNGARVADDSGTVYSTDSLSYTNSLGTAFTDLAFHGTDIPIVLRSNVLHSYNNALLPTGSVTLSATGLRVAVSGSDALVFVADGKDSHGLRLQVVPLADLAAPTPGAPINPRGLPYTPDDVFADRDGNILLFSKAQLSLFRWSPPSQRYLSTLPLIGAPKYAAYSKVNHRAYFAYDTQLVREMNLALPTPAESPLFTLPGAPGGLATAGEFIFSADGSGAWGTHYLFSPTGAQLHALDWNYDSRVWEWDPAKRRMYFFRDNMSPNDLHYETIGSDGKITGEGETPYHGDFNIAPPIRVNGDGSRVVIGSGVVFETAGMTRVTTLPSTFIDASWRTGELLTIRASGTQTQIQRWNASTFAAGAAGPLFAGTPLRLMKLDSGETLLITISRNMPRFYLLNPDLSIASDYQSDSELPPAAVEDVSYSWPVVVDWQGLGTGPYTVTAPVLPAWLSFANGNLTGTPREADSGDQVGRSKAHRVVLRAQNSQGTIAEKELNITVLWTNDAPVFQPGPGPILANDRADDSTTDLATGVVDPDGRDVHQWDLIGNSNPSLFAGIWLDQSGKLQISYAPYVSGTSTVTVKITDASGASATAEFPVILPQLPPPSVKVYPAIFFNRATGLYEQKITVKNIAARAIAGFDLTISGLRAGVSLHNGTTVKKGGGIFSYNKPLIAGESVTVILKYYATKRGAIPQPTVHASLPGPASFAKRMIARRVAVEKPFAVDRCLMQADRSVAIEFPVEAGRNYRVHYSADAVHWKACPAVITSAGNRIQWIDRGPPWTDSAPASNSSRFYRVERLEP